MTGIFSRCPKTWKRYLSPFPAFSSPSQAPPAEFGEHREHNVLRAVRVTRLQEEDTHDYVAESQLIAIALMGVIIVAWCLTALLGGTFKSESALVLVADLVPILLYYRAISRESHSQFWEGVRREETPLAEGETLSATPPADLVLDEKTGYVRAAADGERPCVRVRAWGEFADEHDSESFLRYAERLVKPISPSRRPIRMMRPSSERSSFPRRSSSSPTLAWTDASRWHTISPTAF